MGEMIEPKPLPPGGTIAIVAPAGPMDSEILFEAEELLQGMGYEVLIAPSCFERNANGYLAGESDYERAQDIMMAFAEDSVDAIISMRGGYGCNRLLPYFRDFKFSKYPKPFVGYSDITYMHIYLNQHHHLLTYHGPMLRDLLREDEVTNTHFFNSITDSIGFDIVDVPFFDEEMEGVEGTLIGGNLSIICSTLGTPYEIDTKDKILFMEEVNEALYSIDRMIMQLMYAGKLHDCKGIILGDFNVADREANDALLNKMLSPLKKPIAYHIPSGHCSPLFTLPMGAAVTLNPGDQSILFDV